MSSDMPPSYLPPSQLQPPFVEVVEEHSIPVVKPAVNYFPPTQTSGGISLVSVVVIILFFLLGIGIFVVWCMWPNWEAYVSSEGNFGVMMPDKPTPFVRDTELAMLGGKISFHTLELEQDAMLFAVAYTDLPKDIEIKPGFLDDIGIVNLAGIFAFKMEPGFATKITLKHYPYPGREYKFSDPKHGSVVLRVFLVNRRLYLVLVCGEDVNLENTDVVKFLDSFDFYDDPK